MKILFTGASSFTGFWFVSKLAEKGHEVHAICRKSLDSYEGLRKKRLHLLSKLCQIHESTEIGSFSWNQLIAKETFDLFCHHAAETTDYKSPYFDPGDAVAKNTQNARLFLEKLKEKGCNRLLLTGSFFESMEGGSLDNRAFTPYGLSKSLSYQIFLFHAEALSLKLGKFVIPNPFGPYEEYKFTSYLIDSWKQKKIPKIQTPKIIRDNIPVDALAVSYANFASNLSSEKGVQTCRPSGFVETQLAFTQRFAREIEKRVFYPCPFTIEENPIYQEPMELKNEESALKDWDENRFWTEWAKLLLIENHIEKKHGNPFSISCRLTQDRG